MFRILLGVEAFAPKFLQFLTASTIKKPARIYFFIFHHFEIIANMRQFSRFTKKL